MTVTAEEARTVADPSPARDGPARARAWIRRESVVLFVLSYTFYAALGYFVVVSWNIVVGDAFSRLAHAYFVWFNAPPKLTAIGFVWPPLMTIVLLPLALVKPLATSLLALPLTSALFAAALVVTLDRALGFLGLGRWTRLSLVALIAANPIVVYYATNGMGESLYLFLLTLGVFYFLRWHESRRASHLILASLALALGLLTRYEILFWVIAVALAIVVVLVRRGATWHQIEGPVLAFLVPAGYALGLWMFFNWLILGDPLWWLQSEVTLTFEETRREAVDPTHVALMKSFVTTLDVSWLLFPATFVVIAALLLLAAVRRDFVALFLAVVIALNPLTTAVLAVLAETDFVYQLRYNMRPIPLALVGIGWLYQSARSLRAAWPQHVVWGAAVLVLGGSALSTWRAMETYERQAFEQAFVRGVGTWSDQEGTMALGSGLPVGIEPEREAAEWIRENISQRDAVLVDDAQGFGVMLLTGRPDLFLDRIDVGEDEWLRVLARPGARVEYFMSTRSEIQGRDRVRDRYPEGADWLEPAFVNSRWRILRVTSGAPGRREPPP